MIAAHRKAFNKRFNEEEYKNLLQDLENRFATVPGFRIAETPVFISRELKQRLFDATTDIMKVINRSDFKELTQGAFYNDEIIVPNEDEHPKFIQMDFGICQDENGDPTPKLIELSDTAFGSVVALRASDGFFIPAPFLVAHIPNIGEQQRLAGFLDCVMTEQSHPGFGANAAKYHMAHYYFVHLARMAKDPIGKPTAAQKLMARFANLMEQDFATGNGLSDYADKLGVTTTHLTRVSQMLNECTASQMLQDRILAEARILLSATDRPVAQISSGLGFTSAAYFTRLFSQKSGMAPTDFRHQIQRALRGS